MRNRFRQYFPLNEKEYSDLWKDSLIVLDTNVLCNTYRYSSETSKEILKLLTEIKSRVWIPHQVGVEFHRNRLDVIKEQKNIYESHKKQLTEIKNKIITENKNPFLSEGLSKKFENTVFDINNEFDEKIDFYNSLYLDDKYLNQIDEIIGDDIGNAFTNENLEEIYLDGEKRYKSKVPPGFADIKKSHPEKYGDLIIWKEILAKGKESKKSIIFIIDDRKEDWWLKMEGKTILPHPSLREEFYSETDMLCHFYKPFQFLEYANQYIQKSIPDSAIEEVKELVRSLEEQKDKVEIQVLVEYQSHNHLDTYIKELESIGYDIIAEKNDSNTCAIYIMIPNIPEVESRFKRKYIESIANFELKVLSYKSSSFN
jgi:hypothetical protein